jgi:hypothetical protein
LQYTNKGATLLNVFIKDLGSGSATYTTGSTTVAWFVNPAATTAYYTITLGRGDTFSYSYIAPLPAVQIVPIQ